MNLYDYGCSAFNWTETWLSWLMVIVLVIITLVFYFIPLRVLLMLWGINKCQSSVTSVITNHRRSFIFHLSRPISHKSKHVDEQGK